jgi:tRNA threonylcarbamoyladenosine dehydratase
MHADSSSFPERFSRTVTLYGEQGFARIRRAAGIVVGQGGVGAHAAVALARTGVGQLTLIDHDELTTSSLNRFPAAVNEDAVGRAKVDLMRDHIVVSCPHTEVLSVQAFFDSQSADALLSPQPDFVVDAIDSRDAKVHLLATCHQRGIPVFSSMGAAGKTDPTLLRVADIGATRVCALAGRIRRALRDLGIESGIECVYTLEKPDKHLIRRNRLPSSISMPGIFGYTLAARVAEFLSRS